METGERKAMTSGLPAARKVRLAVGLGNPGAGYAGTRHNAGVWLVERLAAARGWDFSKVGDVPADLAGPADAVRLARTRTWMNESGAAVAGLARYLGVAPASVLVAHDESDLSAGTAGFKFGGGLAGHNGLKDVADRLGTTDFWRLRIGIGHPKDSDEEAGARIGLKSYVLSEPDAPGQAVLDEAMERAVSSWRLVEAGDMDKAMRALHLRVGG